MGATRFPHGVSDAGDVTKRGTVEVTGATLEVETGLSSIEGCNLTLAQDPGAGAGDVAILSYTASGGTLTIKIWQDDLTAATEDTTVSYLAWGAE